MTGVQTCALPICFPVTIRGRGVAGGFGGGAGFGGAVIVVADTSPLLALLAVQQAEILPRLFQRVVVPEGVRAGELV